MNRDEWEKQVEETLAFLKEIGVDTVFFMAKDPWGYVYYNSSIAPLTRPSSTTILSTLWFSSTLPPFFLTILASKSAKAWLPPPG